jgi:BirA family biotin operon repressor/biotin-[acetyl-CoA-carboxylase] ligase
VSLPAPPADRILAWLRAASGPLSGEDLARRLGCSRAAVFKHVEALRGRGYGIDARHATGYVLTHVPDRLDASEVTPHCTGRWRRIVWFAETDSTQRVARDLARGGAEEGTVVVAEAQTAGRGRLGRSWHSPSGVNVYASIVLRPPLPPARVPQLALVAGLAVAEAVERTASVRAQLKWPNDVIVDDRKLAGILTEMDAEVERVQHVVVGIGINVNVDAFPDELRDRATSLRHATGAPVARAPLLAALLAALEARYDRFVEGGFAPLRGPWQARSWLDGKEVRVAAPEGQLTGRVLGLDDDGALRIAAADGTVQRVVAGEVTLSGVYEA